MTTRIFVAALIVASVTGCKSKQEKAFERVALEVNPIFRALRPSVTKMLALAPDRHEEIQKLCLGQDSLLGDIALHADALEASELRLPRGVGTVPERARRMRFLFHPEPCHELVIEERGPARCAAWCLEHWRALSDAVDTLREKAKAVDVNIEPIVEGMDVIE